MLIPCLYSWHVSDSRFLLTESSQDVSWSASSLMVVSFWQVLEICAAILVHKSIIVFSLSLKLVQSAVPPLWIAAYLTIFAMMSPIGIAIGISVMEAQLSSGALIQAILEGLAAGTFIYITFMEILPHELNSAGNQLLKVIFILVGFSIMAGLMFFLEWDVMVHIWLRKDQGAHCSFHKSDFRTEKICIWVEEEGRCCSGSSVLLDIFCVKENLTTCLFLPTCLTLFT